MSNNFWYGLAAVGAVAWYAFSKKGAVASAPSRVPSDGSLGATATGARAGLDGGAPGTTVGAAGGAGDGVSAYGQFPGLAQAGAAGVDTSSGGDSGTLDNSRVYDPYAQSQADPQWIGTDTTNTNG